MYKICSFFLFLHFLNHHFIEWQCGICYNAGVGNQRAKAAYPPFTEGLYPPDVRKEGLLMYVTYSDLIQIGIFICALVGLCYTIFKGKKK